MSKTEPQIFSSFGKMDLTCIRFRDPVCGVVTSLQRLKDSVPPQHVDSVTGRNVPWFDLDAKAWKVQDWIDCRDKDQIIYYDELPAPLLVKGVVVQTRALVPLIFTINGTLYIVDTSEPPTFTTDSLEFTVHPLVFSIGEDTFCNADVPTICLTHQPAAFIHRLWLDLMKKLPFISTRLLYAAEVRFNTIKVLGKRRGTKNYPPAVVFSARPLEDLDWHDQYYLYSQDEGRDFLSLLPHKAITVKRAFDSLCPLTRSQKRNAVRTGEWWFLPADEDSVREFIKHADTSIHQTVIDKLPSALSEKERLHVIKNSGGIIKPPQYKSTYSGVLAVLEKNSAHFADILATDGDVILVKGFIRHLRHEHEPINLDKWCWAIKNGAIKSWSISTPMIFKRL